MAPTTPPQKSEAELKAEELAAREAALAKREAELAERETAADKPAAGADPSTLRGRHVAALKTERDTLARRPESDARTRRLAEVDAEIDKYSKAPTNRRREKA